MKYIYALMFLFALSLNAQTEKPSFGIAAEHLTANDTVIGYMNNIKKGENYILDFGDGTKLFVDADYEGNQFQHKFAKEGDYIVNFIRLNPDATKEVLGTKKVSLKKPRTFLVIKKITIKDYNPIKSNGAAWDNSFGGILPDVYVSFAFNDDGKEFKSTENKIHFDLKQKTTSSWVLDNLKIGPKTRERGVSISFFDSDSVTNHDYMGGIAFAGEDKVNAIFKEDSGVLNVDDVEKFNVAFEVEYAWE